MGKIAAGLVGRCTLDHSATGSNLLNGIRCWLNVELDTAGLQAYFLSCYLTSKWILGEAPQTINMIYYENGSSETALSADDLKSGMIETLEKIGEKKKVYVQTVAGLNLNTNGPETAVEWRS